MKKYFIGIDAGGSKAAYALADRQGKIINLHISKGFSRVIDKTSETVDKLKKGIDECLSTADITIDDVAAICFGTPSYGEISDKDAEFTKTIKTKYHGIECSVVNDAEVGWAGSLACEPGINIVAGTGSIAFGKDSSGNSGRSGGWSPFFSDEGSCYWLGRKAMELFSKQADGRIKKGVFYKIICDEFKLTNDYQFMNIMDEEFIPERKKVAKMQLYLELAAAKGDISALDIYREAADELLLIIYSLAKQLDFGGKDFPVSYSGGLFMPGDHDCTTEETKEKQIVEPLRHRVESIGGHLQKPLLEPYMGAVLLAIQSHSPELLGLAIENMKK